MSEITYTMQGDYQLPNLKLPEQRSVVLGKYASLRRKYLKEHHRVLYYNLLTSCKLEEHLAEVEQRATSMEEILVQQMAEKQGVTERLKAEDMMAWVRKMNNLRNSAQEIVLAEVVYA
ncbi:TnpV protein [bacterium D16-76]|nr:TnpV protein [bacterium D16-76]